MNKLSRKEFKELLTEWRDNFINERGKYQSSFVSPEEDYLSTIRDEKGRVIGELLDYLDEKLSNSFNKYGKNILYKNKENIELISNFLKQKGYKEEASDITEELNNNSALFITHDSGGALSLSGQYYNTPEHVQLRVGGKPDITWLLHDFVHIFIEGDYDEYGLQDYVFEDEDLKNYFKSKVPNYHEEYDVADGGLYSMMDDEGYDILINANTKFFNEINFTPGVGGIDTGASAYAYCWMKMKHKEDFKEIDKSFVLNNEEKEAIKEYLKSIFPIVTKVKNLVLKTFKNTIVIVPVLK